MRGSRLVLTNSSNLLSQALGRCRRAFTFVGVFSLAVNLLMLTTSVYLMQVFDRVLTSGSHSTLLYLTVIAAGALLILALLEIVRLRALVRVSIWLERRLAPAALARTLDGALARGGEPGGALGDLGTLRAFLGGPGVLSLFDMPWVPVYLAVIYLLDPLLGHVALAGAVVLASLAVANDLLTHASLKRAGAAARGAARTASAAVRNAEVIDALGLSEGIVRRWAREGSQALQLQAVSSDRAAIVLGASKFVRLFVQIAILAVGALLVLQQDLTGGAMIAASIIMGRALAPVEQAIGTWKQVVQAREAHRRLKAFFAQAPRRSDAMQLPAPRGHLSVESVVYGFAMGRPPVLKGVSFAVQPGEAVAVIGPSAAGKSTLARLLVGVDKPSAGLVRLDGADMFTWPRADLGQHIGYLPQDVELFSGSVAENIARLGEPDPERVVEAARRANCHEMILRLEQGYETELGEGGVRLSSGQRQRIALARALYGSPKLVILDEPNANLDGEGELALSQAIAALKNQGAAVVIISHRPGTLAAVDKILVLVDGKVEHFGQRQAVLDKLGRRRLRAVEGGSARPAAGISSSEGTALSKTRATAPSQAASGGASP